MTPKKKKSGLASRVSKLFGGEKEEKLNELLKEINQNKIIVVGNEGCGKTTLIQSLREWSSRTQAGLKKISKSVVPSESIGDTQSTIGVDVSSDLQLSDDFNFRVFDFAGQSNYLSVHQNFMAQRSAVYLLVIDFSRSLSDQKKNLEKWCKYLAKWLHLDQDPDQSSSSSSSSSSPPELKKNNISFICVGTKIDKLTSADQINSCVSQIERISLNLPRLKFSSVIPISSTSSFQGIVKLKNKVLSAFSSLDKMDAASLSSTLEEAKLVYTRIQDLYNTNKRPIIPLSEIKSRFGSKATESIQFLNDVGLISVLPQHNIISVKPDLLSKILSLFVAPSWHLKMLSGDPKTKNWADQSCITLDHARSLLRLLKELEDFPDDKLDLLIDGIQQCGLCFTLQHSSSSSSSSGSNQTELVFPSLKPHADVFCIMPNITGSSGDVMASIMSSYSLSFLIEDVFSETFSLIQVKMSKMIDSRFRIFQNAFMVKKGESTASIVHIQNHILSDQFDVLVTIRGPDVFETSKSLLSQIGQITSGNSTPPTPTPDQSLEAISSAFNLKIKSCCPLCSLQSSDVPPLTNQPDSTFLCPRCNRSFSQQEAQEQGLEITPDCLDQRCDFGFPWQPKNMTSFLQENQDKFQTPNPGTNSQLLTITPESAQRLPPDSPTLIEFTRAREMFFRFVGNDRQHDFVLEKIVFINNPETEQIFTDRFRSFILDSTLRDCSLKIHQDSMWDSISGDSVDQKRQRLRTMMQLEHYLEKFSGNERVNLVAAWHGASQEKVVNIAKGNFWKPRDLTAEELERLDKNMASPIEGVTDPGYFGRGIYFTQFPSYGDLYSGKVQASLSQEQQEGEEGGKKGGDESSIMMMSWVLMGNVYPVVEDPFKKPNLLGKPLKEGFDSHYVLVKNAGSAKTFVPCGLDDSPDYDEIVIPDPSQILPRYVVYYKRHRHSPLPFVLDQTDFSSSSSSGGEIKVVVWVDDKPNDPRTIETMKIVVQNQPSVRFIQLTSLAELKSWLSISSSPSSSSSSSSGSERNQGRLEEMVRAGRVRLVTNRKRMRDEGEEDAGIRLIEWVRSNNQLDKIEVALFCGQDRQVMCLHSEANKILVSENASDIVDFMAFKKIKWTKH